MVGPAADDPAALLGCYSFPNHVAPQPPATLPLGVEIPTVLDALRAELPDAQIAHAAGCAVDGERRRRASPRRSPRAAEADVVRASVLGDRAGLFGRGTSGEGCDARRPGLPGVQRELVEALLATGTPVVLVLLTGRPYALGRWPTGCAAVVQAFFPGEEGGPAVAGVLSGRVNPSGRLPVSVPRAPGGQPYTYLHPPLGQPDRGQQRRPDAAVPFGHGLSYTTFAWDDAVDGAGRAPDGADRRRGDGVGARHATPATGAGAEVVQLYLHDPVAR